MLAFPDNEIGGNNVKFNGRNNLIDENGGRVVQGPWSKRKEKRNNNKNNTAKKESMKL